MPLRCWWIICGVVVHLLTHNACASAFAKNIINDRHIADSAKSDIMPSAEDFSSLSSSVESVEDSALTLEDQVRLLTKQLSALTMRRREDYKMLEESLKTSVRKSAQQFGQAELREEVLKLR